MDHVPAIPSPTPRIAREHFTFRLFAWYFYFVPAPTGDGGQRGERTPGEVGAARADAELVAAVATGDRKALAALYQRFAASLMAVGQRILGDRREAEDLLHDVFLEVWRQAGQFDAARGT